MFVDKVEKDSLLIVNTIQPKELKQTKFIQSANNLFHFVGKLEYLQGYIKEKRISPRYVVEEMDYLSFAPLTRVVIPMTCFCDIKLHSIVDHVDFYGAFGIGFKKDFLLSKGVQPIQYLNPESTQMKDFMCELKSLENDLVPEENKDFILRRLTMIKPIFGKMTNRESTQLVDKNFHDEKEWRFVPNFDNSKDFSLLYTHRSHYPIFSSNSRQQLNNALAEKHEYSLDFTFEEINYLFVGTEEDRIKLIRFILSELDISVEDKVLLCSKIILISNIKEDF